VTTRDGLAAIGTCDTQTGIPRRRHRHCVHLGHHVSHYLEFFNHRNAIDHDQLTRAIDTAGTFIITMWRPRNH
jgi:hypothetical protein